MDWNHNIEWWRVFFVCLHWVCWTHPHSLFTSTLQLCVQDSILSIALNFWVKCMKIKALKFFFFFLRNKDNNPNCWKQQNCNFFYLILFITLFIQVAVCLIIFFFIFIVLGVFWPLPLHSIASVHWSLAKLFNYPSKTKSIKTFFLLLILAHNLCFSQCFF